MRGESDSRLTQEQIDREHERAARWDAAFAEKKTAGWIGDDDWQPTAWIYESADEQIGG